jgi:Na+-translocating ferredoxin:NAD+ oxidoreductase RnfG subunit
MTDGYSGVVGRVVSGVATLAALASAPVEVVIATEYLSVEAAQKALFPQADSFTELALALSGAQRARIAALAGPQPPHRSLRIWKAVRRGEVTGYVLVDEVIGREDFITYAAGIDATGHLGALEVLAYRESHGGEVRNAAWRRQFAGRDHLAQLRVRTDIQNIAGATLSCEHVTQGVRWLMALWQVALQGAARPSG